MAKLVAMLRVKNGILFAEQWLTRTIELVDEIVVVDNGSTDGTFEILQKHPKVMALERTEGFDEGRDKILAHKLARSQGADWILWLDVDEIFEKRLTRSVLDTMMSANSTTSYAFRLFNFHKDYHHFEARYDKIWQIAGPALRMWKDQPSAYFRNLKIHNGMIMGVSGKMKVSSMRIKHLGAVDKDYLQRKTDIYLSVDPVRSPLYLKHRDQSVPVWRWYEYHERPLLVCAQIALLSAIYKFEWSKGIIRAVIRRLASYYKGKTK